MCPKFHIKPREVDADNQSILPHHTLLLPLSGAAPPHTCSKAASADADIDCESPAKIELNVVVLFLRSLEGGRSPRCCGAQPKVRGDENCTLFFGLRRTLDVARRRGEKRKCCCCAKLSPQLTCD